MAEDSDFAHLVALACHDLRTPLATVAGFARMLARDPELGGPRAHYVELIEAAAAQLADLIDEVALVSRIETGRFEPAVEEVDTLDLARAAAARVAAQKAVARGRGGAVHVDREGAERALASLALAALRHGALERIELEAAGVEVRITPVTPQAAPIVLADELRDLGAAVAIRFVDALGGTVTLEGETLRVVLPA